MQLDEKQMKRKLSKRDKKEQKKKEKRAVREAEDIGSTPANLYAEVPPTTFTRTISNPEIVMKKRRERKLAEKLKNIGEGKPILDGDGLGQSERFVFQVAV